MQNISHSEMTTMRNSSGGRGKYVSLLNLDGPQKLTSLASGNKEIKRLQAIIRESPMGNVSQVVDFEMHPLIEMEVRMPISWFKSGGDYKNVWLVVYGTAMYVYKNRGDKKPVISQRICFVDVEIEATESNETVEELYEGVLETENARQMFKIYSPERVYIFLANSPEDKDLVVSKLTQELQVLFDPDTWETKVDTAKDLRPLYNNQYVSQLKAGFMIMNELEVCGLVEGGNPITAGGMQGWMKSHKTNDMEMQEQKHDTDSMSNVSGSRTRGRHVSIFAKEVEKKPSNRSDKRKKSIKRSLRHMQALDWDHYYFCISGGTLYYYVDETAVVPLGMIPLGVASIEVDSMHIDAGQYLITLVTPMRSFLLVAPHRIVFGYWFKNLENAIRKKSRASSKDSYKKVSYEAVMSKLMLWQNPVKNWKVLLSNPPAVIRFKTFLGHRKRVMVLEAYYALERLRSYYTIDTNEELDEQLSILRTLLEGEWIPESIVESATASLETTTSTCDFYGCCEELWEFLQGELEDLCYDFSIDSPELYELARVESMDITFTGLDVGSIGSFDLGENNDLVLERISGTGLDSYTFNIFHNKATIGKGRFNDIVLDDDTLPFHGVFVYTEHCMIRLAITFTNIFRIRLHVL